MNEEKKKERKKCKDILAGSICGYPSIMQRPGDREVYGGRWPDPGIERMGAAKTLVRLRKVGLSFLESVHWETGKRNVARDSHVLYGGQYVELLRACGCGRM